LSPLRAMICPSDVKGFGHQPASRLFVRRRDRGVSPRSRVAAPSPGASGGAADPFLKPAAALSLIEIYRPVPSNRLNHMVLRFLICERNQRTTNLGSSQSCFLPFRNSG